MQITTELIKELRDATSISVMQCKRALEEADGDMNKALAILKKTSSDIATKKANRETKDGSIMIKIEGNKAILVTLHCETDFVSKNEDFVSVLNTLINEAFELGIDKMKEDSKSLIDGIIQKTGENVSLGEVYEMKGDIINSYNHNNKVGVIVSLKGGNKELAKDIAMHIAAMKPEYIKKEDINEEAKKMVIEIFEKEIASIDKPEEIKKKMLEGKINTYFKEKTLLEQIFIKNSEETISSLLDKNKAQIIEVKYCSI